MVSLNSPERATESKQMRYITTEYVVHSVSPSDNIETPCSYGGVIKHVYIDMVGTEETPVYYTFDNVPSQGFVVCTETIDGVPLALNLNDFVDSLYVGDSKVASFPTWSRLVGGGISGEPPEDAMFLELEMEGEGGLDIALGSLYTGLYMGGWFATIDIHTFDESKISANFLANPNQYGFGFLALEYHGFTAEELKVSRRKQFIDLHQWFPTLEPGGTVEETNVWVPTPFYPRATAVKWGLYPGVKGTFKAWTCKLLIGVDAYF